jgi:hypothetical protein
MNFLKSNLNFLLFVATLILILVLLPKEYFYQYYFSKKVLNVFWPTVFFPLLITLILCGTGWGLEDPDKNRNSALIIVFSFAMLGMSTGFSMGASRIPAVSTVVPAVLTFIGGLAIYLINEKGSNSLVGFCILALSITLMLGQIWGANQRPDESDKTNTSALHIDKNTSLNLTGKITQ